MSRFSILFPILCALALSVPFVIPAPVHAQTKPDRIALIDAIEAAGCVANQATILTAAGPTDDVAASITQEMLAEGVLVLSPDGFRLTVNGCADAGAAPEQTGLGAAVAWMGALDDAGAGIFVAERLAARNCAVHESEFEAFIDDVARTVAQRYGVELPEPLPTEEDAELGAFIVALVAFGERGGRHLIASGAVTADSGISRLLECPATADPLAPQTIREPELFQALLEIGREELIAIEAAAFASIDCAIPIDMGFTLHVMMLDRLLAAVGFDAGPSLALR